MISPCYLILLAVIFQLFVGWQTPTAVLLPLSDILAMQGKRFFYFVPFLHYACIKDSDPVTSNVANCVLIKT